MSTLLLNKTKKLVFRLKPMVDQADYLARHPDCVVVEGELPSQETLEEWMFDAGCEATDGCWVEPDGTCPHGHPSWLLALGLI